MASYKLLPGDIFNHAYEVNQEIGAGGFAKVYLVKDIRNQDQYALKLLNQDADQDDVKKFIYEANIMGLLEHDHIVKVEGMHTLPSAADPDRYLLMQYAPNGSAEDALNRQAPVGLSVPTTVGYTEQTADALQYLHNRQILHMDVKPANMLLSKTGEVLLSDFGNAIHLRDLPPKVFIGSPVYMSPEALRKQPSPQSDQFALAVATYEFLCGNEIYPFPTVKDTLHSAPIPIQQQVAQFTAVLAELERVVAKGLAKKEEDRYDSVTAYAQALADTFNNAINARLSQPGSVHPSPGLPPTVPALQAKPQALPPTIPAVPWKKYPNPNQGNAIQSQIVQPPQQPIIPNLQPRTPNIQPGRNVLQPPAMQPMPNLPHNPNRRYQITRRQLLSGAFAVGLSAIGYGLYKEIPSVEAILGLNRVDAPPNTVAVYDLLTNADPQGGIYDIAWSPDGKHIAFGNFSNGLQQWNPFSTGNEVTLDSSRAIDWSSAFIAWSPDGRYISGMAGTTEYSLLVVDKAGNQAFEIQYFGDADAGRNIAWSPNSKYIATNTREGIWIVDTTGRKGTDTSHEYDTNQHIVGKFSYMDGTTMYTGEVTWSPDGRYVSAVVSNPNNDVMAYLWDAESGRIKRVHQIEMDPSTYSGFWYANWSPDGKYIILNSGAPLIDWEIATDKFVTIYKYHSENVGSISWSPDSKHAVSGDVDSYVRVWNPATGKTEVAFRAKKGQMNCKWSPDGNYIASTNGSTIWIWDPGI